MSNLLHLYHADVLDALPKMPTASVRVAITSPPYNIKKSYGVYKDDRPREGYMRWCRDWLTELLRITIPTTGHLFLNVGAISVDPMIPYDVLREALAAGWVLQNRILWVKSIAINETLSYGHFKPLNSERFLNELHEEIWHLTPTGKSPLARKAEGVGVAYQDPTNAKRWANGGDGRRCGGNVWYIPYPTVQASEQKEHPCPFPLELPLRAARLAGVVPGDWVLDPFMGRGTTGEAALQLGAGFVGVDLEEEWFQIASKNLNKMLPVVA